MAKTAMDEFIDQHAGGDGAQAQETETFSNVEDDRGPGLVEEEDLYHHETESGAKRKANKLILLVPVLVIVGMVGFMVVTLTSSKSTSGTGGPKFAPVSAEAPVAPAASKPVEQQASTNVGATEVPDAPPHRMNAESPMSVPPHEVALPPVAAAEPSTAVMPAQAARPTANGDLPVLGNPPQAPAPIMNGSITLQSQVSESPTVVTQEKQSMSPSELSDQARKMKALEETVAALQKQVNDLHAANDKKNKPAPHVTEPAKPAAKPAAKVAAKAVSVTPPKHRSDYHVYAIIDGRAWLTSKAEKTNYTVAVGDRLPDGSIIQGLEVSDTKLRVTTTQGEIVSSESPKS